MDLIETPQAFITENAIKPIDKIYGSAEDFRDDKESFYYIMSIPDGVTRDHVRVKFKEIGLSLGIGKREYDKLYKEYELSYKAAGHSNNNQTNFTDQPIKLRCGEWIADDTGVYRLVGKEFVKKIACSHPITIEKLLVNIHTGNNKVVIAYRKRGIWKHVIYSKSTISNVQSVLKLANIDIGISSANANQFVTYLCDLIEMNEDLIPIESSVSNLGWSSDNTFTPFNGKVALDSETEYYGLFKSIHSKGDQEEWRIHMKEIRHDTHVRLLTSASFASILLKSFGISPFAVHIYGKSGTGKTVALMAAASVWGNPDLGQYMHSMNSTVNYTLRVAAFLQDLPFIADEMQTIKTSNGFENYDKFIYAVTEGADKGRANKEDGVNKTTEWSNIFITSGEEPITMDNSGGGATGRVLELNVSNINIVENVNKTANLFRQNYGFMGREFVEIVKRSLDEVKAIYTMYFNELVPLTEAKQASALAVILAADAMTAKHFFEERQLVLADYKFMLKSKDETSVAERAYKWLGDIININQNKFITPRSGCYGEVWGKISNGRVYFISTKLNELMKINGYSMKALQDEWIKKDYLIPGKTQKTDNCKVDKYQARCYVFPCEKLKLD